MIFLKKGDITSITTSNNSNSFSFDYESFGNALKQSESSGNYKAKNWIGALGAYQFMPTTIRQIANELGIETPDDDTFLNDTNLQDSFFRRYAEDLFNYAQNNFSSYVGKPITGKKTNVTSTINYYGLVAGQWLAGSGNAEKYFKQNYDAYDGNTYFSDYVAKFSSLFGGVV